MCASRFSGIVVIMLLETLDVTKRYGNTDRPLEVLKGITLSIERGQFVSIVGPSGSGKSTLLHLFGGIDRPSSGTIRLNGKDIGSLSDHELSLVRRRELGFVFQFFNLLPALTAIENITLPLLVDGKSHRSVESRAVDLLAMVGLEGRSNHRPDQLSGGEMQRVAIARALMADPELILADEPTGNLDSRNGKLILDLLQEIVRVQRKTVVMVTHDQEAASRASRTIRMADGMVVSEIAR